MNTRSGEAMDCIKCGQKLTDEEMKDYERNYIRTCKSCRSKYNKDWRKNNPDKVKHNAQKHSTKNSAKTRAYQRQYARNIKKKVMHHYSPNGTCQWPGCDWNNIDALSIDHINDNGVQHRRTLYKEKGRRGGGNRFYLWIIKNNFPEGLQVLCMNHQWVKRANYYRRQHEERSSDIEE